MLRMRYSKDKPALAVNTNSDFEDNVVRCAEIVEALTATTRVEDLAEALA
jgi:hypothetical protein